MAWYKKFQNTFLEKTQGIMWSAWQKFVKGIKSMTLNFNKMIQNYNYLIINLPLKLYK